MSRFDAEARTHFISMIVEGLQEAGFTGVSLQASPMPEATIASLKTGGDDDDEIPLGDPAFAEEVGYHRVTTDQAAFGIWFEPYVTLDLTGTGLPIAAFYPPETASEIPEGWNFIGLDEGTFEKLYVELTKQARQP